MGKLFFQSLKGKIVAKLVADYLPLLSLLLSMKTLTIYYSLMVDKTSTLFLKIVVAIFCLLLLKVVDAWFVYLKLVSVSNFNSKKGRVWRSAKLRTELRRAHYNGVTAVV